ncbi:MAG: hypothetical protein LAQ69_42730 [Acidobacteriia bacterium]|nr:hypothetical protein [Terriglobia bacterium]
MGKNLFLLFSVCLAGAVSLGAQGDQGQAGQSPAVQNPSERGFIDDSLDVPPLTTLRALRAATRVVYVESLGSEVSRGIGRNIFTYTMFKVLRAIKGSAQTEIRLRLLGGRIDNEEVSKPITLDFTRGDRFILFLGANNAEGFPTIIPQALYAVRLRDGVEVVVPTPNGLPFYHARDHRPYSGRTLGMAPLEDFLYSLEYASKQP